MWYGGWRSCADRDQYGNDRIYHSTSRDLEHWTSPAAVIVSSAYHFNDPSVVRIDYPINGVRTPVYLMYMTGCSTAADCFTTGHNITYGATSYDGVTWSNPRTVIGTANGLNAGGAWSPSAVKVSDELIYIYYFVDTGLPSTDGQVQRATIHPHADFFAASEPAVVVAGYHVNADVHRTVWGYEMLYDSGDPFNIQRLVSGDGLHFTPDPTFPGINGAPTHRALTGHMFSVPGVANEYWLYFAWSTGPSSADSITIMGWRWQRR
jgi:hypothetical protein